MATDEMDAGNVRSNVHRRRTRKTLGTLLSTVCRRPGIIYRGVYARARARICVCVCVSFAITQNPRVFCFREIDGDHGDRIGY